VKTCILKLLAVLAEGAWISVIIGLVQEEALLVVAFL
jgi:hypothetical protein